MHMHMHMHMHHWQGQGKGRPATTPPAGEVMVGYQDESYMLNQAQIPHAHDVCYLVICRIGGGVGQLCRQTLRPPPPWEGGQAAVEGGIGHQPLAEED